MNIILLGYRGSGKTTLGKLMADQLWKDFVDTDAEVCKIFDGESVAQIWEKHGQAKWRDAELEVAEQVCQRQDQVIALGGGLVVAPEARQVVVNAPNANRIYLYCTAEELHRRITADPGSGDSRPPLTDQGGSLEEVQRVLAERDPIYREVADQVFEVTHVTIRSAVRYVVDRCL